MVKFKMPEFLLLCCRPRNCRFLMVQNVRFWQNVQKRSGRGFETPRNGLGEASKCPETVWERLQNVQKWSEKRFKMIRFSLGQKESQEIPSRSTA